MISMDSIDSNGFPWIPLISMDSMASNGTLTLTPAAVRESLTFTIAAVRGSENP